MEVASPPPAPFGSRAKRHYPGSPGFVDSTNRNPFATIPGDSSDEYMQQRSFKRRRFATPDESMGTDTENNQNHAFMQFQHQPSMAKGNSNSFTTHGKFIDYSSRWDAVNFFVTSGLCMPARGISFLTNQNFGSCSHHGRGLVAFSFSVSSSEKRYL